MQIYRKILQGSLTLLGVRKVFVRSHSATVTTVLRDMKIKLVPALEDNYMYLLIDEKTGTCAAVDPVEPDKIMAASKDEGVKVSVLLTTHHHWDHAGGNEQLLKLTGPIPVYGGDSRIGGLTNKVNHDDKFKIGSLSVQCLFTPCHTSGHICYYVTGDGEEPAVFTGDTLFSAGCGRFFEGNPSQMYTALVEILAKLPSHTKVFCGHEYTINNLKYALHAEPDNTDMKAKLSWAESQRAKGLPTIPSTIAEELKINPFMRVGSPSAQKHTGKTDPIEVMRFLRQEKDSFRPR